MFESLDRYEKGGPEPWEVRLEERDGDGDQDDWNKQLQRIWCGWNTSCRNRNFSSILLFKIKQQGFPISRDS